MPCLYNYTYLRGPDSSGIVVNTGREHPPLDLLVGEV